MCNKAENVCTLFYKCFLLCMLPQSLINAQPLSVRRVNFKSLLENLAFDARFYERIITAYYSSIYCSR